jgi:hypothetical protein
VPQAGEAVLSTTQVVERQRKTFFCPDYPAHPRPDDGVNVLR